MGRSRQLERSSPNLRPGPAAGPSVGLDRHVILPRMAALTSTQKAKILHLHDQVEDLCRYMLEDGGMRDEWLHRAVVLLIEARVMIEVANDWRDEVLYEPS